MALAACPAIIMPAWRERESGGVGSGASAGRRLGRAIRTERYRYTEWLEGKAGRELYDHSTDSNEVANLAADPQYAEVLTALSGQLKKYVQLQPHKR